MALTTWKKKEKTTTSKEGYPRGKAIRRIGGELPGKHLRMSEGQLVSSVGLPPPPPFDPMARLPRDLRGMVAAYIGPLHRFICWARSVCRAWRAWIPAPLWEEVWEVRRHAVDYSAWRHHRYCTPWSVSKALYWAVQREPDQCCVNLGSLVKRSFELRSFDPDDLIDLIAEAVKFGKISLLSAFIQWASFSKAYAGGTLPFIIVKHAVHHNRCDVLRHFSYLIALQEQSRRVGLFWTAVSLASADTLALLLDLDIVSLSWAARLDRIFEPVGNVCHAISTFGELSEKMAVLTSRGATEEFYQRWVKVLLVPGSYSVDTYALCVGICLLRKFCPVGVLCVKLVGQRGSTRNQRTLQSLHFRLSPVCGCKIAPVSTDIDAGQPVADDAGIDAAIDADEQEDFRILTGDNDDDGDEDGDDDDDDDDDSSGSLKDFVVPDDDGGDDDDDFDEHERPAERRSPPPPTRKREREDA